MHGTRKTCGSLLAALDVHPRFAMQILRHSKIAVTMEIYTRSPRQPPARHLRSSVSGSTRTLDLTAALRCCTKIENDRLQDHNRPLNWVGDTGIEPVTSSV